MRADVPEIGADGHGDAVTLRVEQFANSDRVTRLALVVVLVHRRLEQERVLAARRPHLSDAYIGGLDKHIRSRVHEVPHLGVRRHR